MEAMVPMGTAPAQIPATIQQIPEPIPAGALTDPGGGTTPENTAGGGGRNRDHAPAPDAWQRPADLPERERTLMFQGPLLLDLTEIRRKEGEKLSSRQILWVAIHGQM